MALRNHVSESQLNLDLDLEVEKEVLGPEDEEFLTLLEQVLTDVFIGEPDKESFEYLECQNIYDLSTDKEIADRLKYEEEALNEGHPIPSAETLSELEALSRAYFECPNVYHQDEDDFKPSHITGYIQLYSGEKFDSRGRLAEVWKSINQKLVIDISELMDPESIVTKIEQNGLKWSSIFRIVFYGHPLVEVIGSKIYGRSEAKELLPLSNEYPNILLALPDYEETEANSGSIYEWLEQEFSDAVLCGSYPQISRVTSGHYELTAIRLQEIFEENLEQGSLNRIQHKEIISVGKMNEFIEAYSEARAFIRLVNEKGSAEIGKLYSLSLKVLDDVLFLCSRSFERIEDPLIYAQIKSYSTKLKVNKLQLENSRALMLIQKINRGETVETHLLSLADLESIFEILWGNIGIKIIPEKREIYYDLKERLRVLRAKYRTSSRKGA